MRVLFIGVNGFTKWPKLGIVFKIKINSKRKIITVQVETAQFLKTASIFQIFYILILHGFLLSRFSVKCSFCTPFLKVENNARFK